MRGLLRSIRADRQAGSDYYSDRAEARLLFPVALRFALPAAAIDGDSRTPHWPGRGHPRIASPSVSVRRRRKELAKKADRGFDRAADRDHARDVYPSRGI